ncbi:hypothetical protein [Elioraea sp.]|uniref:hypothetical protein n=1 Tax=Elioraea sp. TaxID=2185103 RepID=UPI0025C3378B|nr:hypothetical protein [Elioraea sp.]
MTALAPTPELASLPAATRDARIMMLCDDAIQRLGDARDVEEVMGLRNAAEAFSLYTRKMKAAVEAQNQCQLVVLLAEARIGAELKAAQERGEVATQQAGRPVSVRAADTSPATLPDIGIPRQRAAEMKKLAAMGEPRIRAEVAAATRERRAPSRRRILDAIPSIARRPPECTQFTLWLRTGANLVPTLGSATAFRALLAEHRMHLPPQEVAMVSAFLSALATEAAP